MIQWANEAVGMACRLLAEEAPPRLPVDVEELIRRQANVRLLTYTQAALQLDLPPGQFAWDAPSPDAFTLSVRRNGQKEYHIFYNEKKQLTRQRFTLAHELGHMLFDRYFSAAAPSEAVMDCFARHLLCPPVLLTNWESRHNPLPERWLCRTFGLSPAAVQRLAQSPLIPCDPALEAGIIAKFAPLLPPMPD